MPLVALRTKTASKLTLTRRLTFSLLYCYRMAMSSIRVEPGHWVQEAAGRNPVR